MDLSCVVRVLSESCVSSVEGVKRSGSRGSEFAPNSPAQVVPSFRVAHLTRDLPAINQLN